MQFTKLRLHGFKSFVDPAELVIEPGLTGIVGPNGCGKSNLVEALQWVMGEGSARRLRGGEMDDVIFGGTETRSPRSVASVSLTLDNSDRRAPALVPDLLNNQDEIEIDRRIDRGRGSIYRVNGREFRARDVQLLFADAASGAHSAALVGQGRIGWVINAKPSERSSILEEAAGIGGLPTRRREAETKLSAAETNLGRVADTEAGLVTQIDRLHRQAKQAERYRRIAEELRRIDALLIYRLWLDRRSDEARIEARLADTRLREADAGAASVAAVALRQERQECLPALREAAADAARRVEHLAAEMAGLEAEERRIRLALDDLARRIVQLDQDSAREQSVVREATQAEARIAADRSTLDAEAAGEAEIRSRLDAALRTGESDVARVEAILASVTERLAQASAMRQAADRRVAQHEERERRLDRQRNEAAQRSRELDLLAVSADRLDQAAAAVQAAESAVTACREAVAEAEASLVVAEQARLALKPALDAAEARVVRLKAEADGLAALLGSTAGRRFVPVLDSIRVAPGYEQALAAALGEDLQASIDESAPARWRGDLPLLEGAAFDIDGVMKLSSVVEAPGALSRRLARVGVVPDFASAARLQAELPPGWRLVTRDGDLCRWDGFAARAGAPTPAAVRLQHRNRLADLRSEMASVETDRLRLRSEDQTAASRLDAARTAERAARARQGDAARQLDATRQAQAALRQQHEQSQARREAAAEQAARLAADLAELKAQLTEALQERERLPDLKESEAERGHHRAELDSARQVVAGHRQLLERHDREAAIRVQRRAALDIEARSWTDRTAGAVRQLAALAERRAGLEAERAALVEQPDQVADRRRVLTGDLAAARERAGAVGRALATAETQARDADTLERTASEAHFRAREELVRAEAQLEQAALARKTASERAREQFECPAEHLPRVAGVPPEGPPEAAAELEARHDKLRRDRDAMGPVNLMAEGEIAELSTELETLRAERDDLTEAIARLRQAIQQLNRDGKHRLLEAFERVNDHFRRLFAELFGGGEAHLELVHSDVDPLAVGLEIMACPPGKRLQVLSLLSGGERALTALALVFAVFLTNPAPICVLDEVDAPLDDANVERFCRLVRSIAGQAGTRFLVITHHRVTMAEMDRLYGVTMAERGISRLVSVELQQAARIRQSA